MTSLRAPTAAAVHPIIPLCLLEAIRNLDTPLDDGVADMATEIVSKRLGLSNTVAIQIERYREGVARGDAVQLEEVVAVFRLISRRVDAQLVFADAGRRAARYAARASGGVSRGVARMSPGVIRRRLGLRTAARVAARVFGAELRPTGGLAEVSLVRSLSGEAGVEGDGCYFYGAAFAELLRVLIGFEGAMLHERCRARDEGECRWRAAAVEGYE